MQTNWIARDTLAALNEGFVVSITLEAKPGEEEAVAAIVRDLVPPSMAEPGVKLFLSYRSPTNKALFHIFELYADEAAWAAHQATEHFKTKVPELVKRLARRERIPYVPFVDSGVLTGRA